MGTDKSKQRPSGSSGAKRAKGAPPRIWAEAGVTIAVTDSPPQFVRFSFGMERTARGRSKDAIVREEESLFEFVTDVVANRVEELSSFVEERTSELIERAGANDDYPY